MTETIIEKYYTLNEIADKIGIPTRTLREKLKNGTLRARKIAGKWRTSETDLKAFIEAAPANFPTAPQQ